MFRFFFYYSNRWLTRGVMMHWRGWRLWVVKNVVMSSIVDFLQFSISLGANSHLKCCTKLATSIETTHQTYTHFIRKIRNNCITSCKTTFIFLWFKFKQSWKLWQNYSYLHFIYKNPHNNIKKLYILTQVTCKWDQS
jgi:hypothetical protein